MTKTTCVSLLAILTLMPAGKVCADSWCDGLADYGITPVFCDDFDKYCTNPDPTIGQCPRDGTAQRRDFAMKQVWPRTSINTHLTWVDGCPPIDSNASEMSLEDTQGYLASAPYGGRNVNNGIGAGHVGQSTADIVPGIKAKFGPQYNEVLGTDAVPLILQFTMNAAIKDAGALFRSVGYLEVGFESGTCVPKQPNGGDLDPEVTPTDWIKVGVEEDPINNPGCLSCYSMCPGPNYSMHVWWPTICQSYHARTPGSICPMPGDPLHLCDPPYCPPVPENKLHSALAVGVVAWLDHDPCHCGTPGAQTPQNYHLAFFDGWKWRSLSSAIFDDGQGNGIPGVSGSGDFTLGHQVDWLTLTIRTSTVDIKHEARQWVNNAYQPWVTSEAFGIPRKYLGAFNVLRSGTASGCELNNGTYRCAEWGSTKAKRTSEGERCDFGTPLHEPDGSKFVSIDNVALLDGIPDIDYVLGACCHPNGTCTQEFAEECLASNGDEYAGPNTQCSAQPCCPHGAFVWADADADGDVDGDDFGKFQACFTGDTGIIPSDPINCICFDRDGGGVGNSDYGAFRDCATGPNIPWSAQLNPACIP